MARLDRIKLPLRSLRNTWLAGGCALLAAVSACQREPAVAPTWSLNQMEAAVRKKADTKSVENQHVVLVALDGVRWQEVFLGVDAELARRARLGASSVVSAEKLMPNVHALVAESGVALGAPSRGAPISASGPNHVSTPGYMEILTGRRRTPCRDNGCRPIAQPTLLDEIVAVPGVDREDVAVVASWEGLEKAASLDGSRIAISVGRSRGVTRNLFSFDSASAALLTAGATAGPQPGQSDFRRDRETAAIALHYLRSRQPRFMFLGLGEPDEYAHHGNYGGYLAAIQRADAVIGQVVEELEKLEQEGRTVTLLVTTDHGRSANFRGHGADPESARVWLVASGTQISSNGYVAAPTPRYLADLAPTMRALFGLPPDPSGDAGTVMHELLGISNAPSTLALKTAR
jgi:hypothetical protein